MHAVFATYVYIMHTFISFVLHTFGIQHRRCDVIWCISQTCYFHLCRLSSTTQTWYVTVRLVTAFTLARLDYCNVILVVLLMSSPH